MKNLKYQVGQLEPPTSTNSAVMKCCLQFSSYSMRKMVVLETYTRVAYFPKPSTDADYRMKQTLPTICSVSQISPS